ncbi:type I polyketide synthase [Streptomyces sp. SID12501]|uniref:SDR family NAD(P)-dependent oxidoreductase n=1 Tax=Streptomyces sp. SID12501 TaxID=2706042 RepID=A0A6B3C5X8_9ACTN|nr:type I polyketide synthase [Streptomyces sp. SID12501]NEC91814.1 SDR family NAD(P)-dependent oxidoreductase [Streptomyces sp. SID12501]
MAETEKLVEYLKRVTAELHETRGRLQRSEASAHEPVAIVGIGCRLPGGADSPQLLWDLVASGRDAVGEVPADRGWDVSYPGGFLSDIASFDAAFFGISPREAAAMDPQQRLLLETAWEAFERAGIDPRSPAAKRTGVFAGLVAQDYGPRLDEAADDIGGHVLTGTTASVATGRVAYTFDFEGPAVTVDTACSSSLVALHLAAGALRRGDCDLALAGGVAVLPTPGMFLSFERQGGLAADGRCKAFGAGADGTGWSEGAGLLLVERLSDARRNGHPVLAVVRGTAVNQDGASNGLTAPSGPAQERVIRAALADAGLTAAEVDAVEAHGTGTRLGDPIEAEALLAVYGQGREQPLYLGSLKSNIGHTQAAAGVAGIIRTVMAMRHGILPRTLHVAEPTHEVDWSTGAVRLLAEDQRWPRTGRPRRAGVSSFGISGTNAHVIVEAPSDDDTPGVPETAGTPLPFTTPHLLPWPLTARSEPALRAQAGTLHRHLTTTAPDTSAADVAWTLTTTRTAMEHRAVALAPDRDELLALLARAADGATPQGVVRGTAPGTTRTVLVFPGQGSQWPGMAVDLLDASPVFARRMAECEAALAPFVDWTLTDVLRAPDAADALSRVDVIQPVLWAVMVSLAELWASCGVRPDAVVGHSQGEIAAAVVAGGLSIEDGARVIALRSRALIALSGRGGMVSVAEPETAVRDRLAALTCQIDLAAVNGPASVVVAGEPDALDELMAGCEHDDVRVKRVAVDYASHSSQVTSIEQELAELLAPVRPRHAPTAFYSALTAGRLDTTGLDAGYWYRNLRHTVRFEETTRALLDDGHTLFIEVSPHPVLVHAIQDTLDSAADGETPGTPATTVLGTLRRGPGGRPERFTEALAEAYAHGATVDWSRLLAGCGARRVELPTYAFQRTRHWLDRPAPTATDDPASTALWEAVGRGDTASVADQIGVPADEALDVTVRALATWRERARDGVAADRNRYRVTWKPVPVPVLGPAPLTGDWVLVEPESTGDLGDWVADALTGHGAAHVHRIGVGPDTGRAELAALLAGHASATGIVSVLGTDTRPHPGHPTVPAGVAATLTAAQAVADTDGTAPLWCLTRGAVAAHDGFDDPNGPCPEQAQVWGLGRVVGMETPAMWGGLIDLPPRLAPADADALCAVLAAPGDEQEWALRETGPRVRRLTRAPRVGGAAWKPGGSVLITGGTGALGAHVARRLAREGARHLVLTGRRGPDAPGAAELAAELRQSGAEVTVAACDVADREALASVLAAIPAAHPLTAVVHAAGVSSLARFSALTPADLAATAAGKVDGARHLDELLRDHDLDAFVLFSSAAAVWGGARQGAYAAANAHLDALAARRRARGLPATCVSWGSWADGGMVDVKTQRVFDRIGLRAMAPRTALTALFDAVGAGEPQLTVSDMDWQAFATGFTLARRRPLLDDIPEAALPTPPAGTVPTAVSALAERLTGLTDRDRDRLLLNLVRSAAATALGHQSPDAVGTFDAFRDLGLDSVTAVDLRNRLATDTGLRLPTTLAFDHPTPAAVAAELRTRLLTGPPAAKSDPVPAAARPADDPVVVVAMACRYPGEVRSPEDLWRLVAEGRDGITGFPVDRGWRATDSVPTTEGGFLHDLADFDAAFFGISPREALAMDPQQRLLLETSWEALERAGIDPLSLRGSRTGVFVGAGNFDYGTVAITTEEGKDYALTGSVGSVASGRISYTLGLEGPAVTVDTACSSSLVALHSAARALRDGECGLALVGGAAVMATTTAYESFARQGGLAADGRCKAFADGADGTGWGEGAGVLVVERLSDARRNGHPVLAVVRGSAVNQDGASNGLTAPNGPSQQRVIRAALASAGLSPSDVDAVEAHGTGTRLGDPIEAQALLATYGQDRERPLYLGSLKSNVGHTQAAAGVGGVIKTVLALQEGVLPPTLHVDEPTGEVDWSAGSVELLTEAREWPETGRPRRAGVSAFGISGTNAHVILEQAPRDRQDAPLADAERALPAVPLLLSGRGPAALRAQAGRLRDFLDSVKKAPALQDIGLTLAAHRAALDHRAAVVVTDEETLRGALDALAAGRQHPGIVTGLATQGDLAVVFSGQGSQRVGMGRELYEAFPVFAAAFDEVCAAFDGLLPGPLKESVFDGPADRMEGTGLAQPALFAVEVALFRLLESWGVRADVLLGHSLGELVAAHVAGVWSLADACRVVAARGRLMQALPSGGAMWAVEASEDETEIGHLPEVSVAAVNGPSSLVLSGGEPAVRVVADRFAAEGRRVKRLAVSHAFHSSLMEPMLAEFAEVLEQVEFVEPVVPVVSNVTGEVAGEELCSPEYWVRHVRATVRFADSVRTLRAQGVGTVLELGPEGSLVPMVEATEPDLVGVPVLRRDRAEAGALLSALAQAHVRGVQVDWSAVFAGTGARCVGLPTYAFQRRRYWPATAGAPAADTLAAVGLRAAGHPLLDTWLVAASGGEAIATGRLASATHPWLADHTVLGTVLLPGTAFVDLACWAGQRLGCPELAELTLYTPLAIGGDVASDLQLVVGAPDGAGRRTVAVYSRPATDGSADDDPEWTRHAEGALAPAPDRQADAVPLVPWPPAAAGTRVPLDGFYPGLIEAGFDYGPSFQGLRSVLRSEETPEVLFAEVELPEEERTSAGAYTVHPALLDAALHALGVDLPAGTPARLPFTWTGVQVHASGADALRVRLSRSADGTVALTAVDVEGGPVVTVDGLVLREVTPDRLPGATAPDRDALFRIEWTALQPAGETGETAHAEPVLLSLDVDGHPDLVRLDGDPDAVTVCCPPGDVADVTDFVLRVLQAWLADERYADTPLVVVTRGAAAVRAPGLLTGVRRDVGDPHEALAHAAVAGLVRAAQAEHPGRFVLVDTDGELPSPATVLAYGEPDLAVRAGRFHGRRLVRATDGPPLEVPVGPWRLDATRRGSISDLALVNDRPGERELAPGEVRIAVRAAGVNFRDTLIALDMYPGQAELGIEGAGVVLEAGPGATRFAPGDRVMGLLDGAFSPTAVTDHRLLAPVPDDWTFAAAAAAPVACLTAWYGLRDLGGVEPGRRVLVHAGAGGVGSAAVQLARHLGAEVFATASTAKQPALHAAGLDAAHVADSRDTGFRERFLSSTGGRGMDVVLNSLAGEFADASLELLPRGGQFVEIGKTDVRDPDRVAADHPGVYYRAFDLGDAGPDRIQEMLGELTELFAAGVLVPPPVTTWDIRRAPEAFRAVAQARLVGKAVLVLNPPPAHDDTVLVTGGTGTLGARVARHLAGRHGVRRLVLTSRSGTDAPGVPELLADLAAAGATAQVAACDIGDRAAVSALLDRLAADGHRLTGIVHCAGTVDDGVLTSLTPDRLDPVLHAKAHGARHLHELTRGLDLHHFVLFSSASATFGAAGQANYCAANAYLDALAERRTADGLPAVSIAWGLWEENSGMTAALGERDRERLRRTGTAPLPTARALALFDTALTIPTATVTAAPLDPAALRARYRDQPVPVLLRELAGPVPRRAAAAVRQLPEPGADFTARLAALPEEERHTYVLGLVLDRTAQVLGHADAAEVDPDQAFKDQGFDSLTAVELRNQLRVATGLAAQATLIFDHPSPVALAEHLLRQAVPAGPGPEELLRRDLDRLETAAEALLPDHPAHAEVADRLRRILHRLDASTTSAATDPADDVALSAASADEVLAYIDSQFGDLT